MGEAREKIHYYFSNNLISQICLIAYKKKMKVVSNHLQKKKGITDEKKIFSLFIII